MAQKLVNFGQKIAVGTPRVATRWGFQALGKTLSESPIVLWSFYSIYLPGMARFIRSVV